MHSIDKILTVVMCKEKENVELRYFICTVDDVIDFAEAVRNHWAIENNLH